MIGKIEINKSMIPYYFEISLNDEMFQIDVGYNATADLFVLGLAKKNESTGEYETLCSGEPVIYGVPLWRDVYVSDKYPSVDIVPQDLSGGYDAVTFDNLNQTVFLWVGNKGEFE